MNRVKEQGEQLRILLEDLENDPDVDDRWVEIAETHLQQGIMAAVRSVAKPESF